MISVLDDFDTENKTLLSPQTFVYYALDSYPISINFFLVNVLTGLIGIAVIILNSVVVITMIREKTRQDPSNYIIANMAASDTFTGASVIHTMLQNLINFQSTLECLIRLGIVHSFFHSSVTHLLFLTVTRYVKIMFPFQHSRFIRRRNVIAVSVFLWIVSILYGCMPLMGMYNKPKPGEERCRYVSIMTKEYLLLSAIVVFYPICSMNLMYAHIVIVAKRHHKTIASLHVAESKQPKSWKFTKTIIIICGAYFFCALPLAVTFVLMVNGKLNHLSKNQTSAVLMYTMLIAIINSLVNPIIYAIKMPAVNRAFNRVFCRKCCRRMCPKLVKKLEISYDYSSGSAQTRSNVRLSHDRGHLAAESATSLAMQKRSTTDATEERIPTSFSQGSVRPRTSRDSLQLSTSRESLHPSTSRESLHHQVSKDNLHPSPSTDSLHPSAIVHDDDTQPSSINESSAM